MEDEDPKFLKIIAENMRDVISIFDPDFKRHYISKSIIDLLGYTVPEIMSMDVNDPIPPEDHTLVGPTVNESIAAKKSCIVEHRLIHKNGTQLWVETLVKPIFDSGGELIWILTSARDISDRKSKERELDTERKLRERLYNLSSISHEIRTPLTALMSSIELLRQGKHASQQDKLIQMLNSSGEILLALLNNVLDYTRIQDGKTIVQEIDFDLHQVCENVASYYRNAAEDKGLQLKTSIAPEVPRFVRSDSYKLAQIIGNLLGNAIKYTRQGTISFMLERHNQNIVLTVSDTGVGIRQEFLDQVFEPFVQTGNFSDMDGGSGLGLAIVKTLVELLNGSISVKSILNQGTTFRLALPLIATDEDNKVSNTIENMRILLVEDVATNQMLYRMALESAGAHCDIANDIDAAVVHLETRHYDIILLDIHLSSADGLSLMALLRHYKKEIPVIAFTADATDQMSTTALASGVREIITKPARFSSLIDRISRYRPIHRYRSFDLAIYDNLYTNHPEEYYKALQLLKEDLDFFSAGFEKAIGEQSKKLMYQSIHRIRPIAEHIKFYLILEKLNFVAALTEESNWAELQRTRTAVHGITAQLHEALTQILQIRK